MIYDESFISLPEIIKAATFTKTLIKFLGCSLLMFNSGFWFEVLKTNIENNFLKENPNRNKAPLN